MAVGASPALPSAAWSGVMVTVVVRAPLTLASRTPLTDSMSGTTTVSNRSASHSESLSEVAANTRAGSMSVLPATTVGSTSSGNWRRLTARCISLTASPIEVPKSNWTWMVARFSVDTEVSSDTPCVPLTAVSMGRVTWSSTRSGEAPGYGAITAAAGNSIGGRSSCFSDGTAKAPATAATTAISATRARLARLSLASFMNDSPPRFVSLGQTFCLRLTIHPIGVRC